MVYECLNPPTLSDLDDTDDEVDTVLLLLSNLWSDKSEGDGVEQPITLIVSGPGSGLTAAHSLTPAVLHKALTRAPPIFQQSPGGWLIMGTCLDYGN